LKALLKKLSLSLLVVFLHTMLFGQVPKSDSLVLSSSRYKAISNYDLKLNENSRLYNGIEFINSFPLKGKKGFPYFLINNWQYGSIFYNGQLYEHVPLLFDTFQNRVIVDHPVSHEMIELNTEGIKYFIIANKYFVHLDTPFSGFYQQVYGGDTKIYTRHYKTVREKVDSETLIIEYIPKQKSYILKNGTYYLITSKRSALNVLKEHKSDLNKLLNQENISFKKNKDHALSRMGQYFDQLNTQK
jgi:hypothetical protein